ncbi:MAG: hypothetical protein FJX54_14995 [Alphaproteobacteria bacterium]|nr:hypothetical protein [Alphaproteobacteria bacterium]
MAATGAAEACEPPRLDASTRIDGKRHVLLFRGVPSPPPLNTSFAVEIAVCARDGASVAAPRVDAWMPAHRHGMNYRPSVVARAPGSFRADGLLLHMPGRWEFVFEVGGERLTATQTLD